jgi:NADH-quinone oxidoreductase subunit M
MSDQWILTTITFLPLAGAIGLLFFNKEAKKAIAWYATAVAFLGMLVSFPLFWRYDPAGAPFQFLASLSWIPSIGASYHVGVDGISILLILLTTILGFLSILSSWTAITERVKEYYVMMLILQTGMLGVFIALDFFLFYVFWEVMLVPMYFLIGVWGGPRKLYAAIKFFLYTLLGSVLMLLGILALYFYHGGATGNYTFDVVTLMEMGRETAPAWLHLSRWIFLAFFVGFAIKVPMFPFHTWLPDAHVEAPTAGSVILAGVLLKMGTYGFVRFSLPILPYATRSYLPWLLGLCVIGIIYGAMVAMVQKDWKKLVAYSSVSHLGFCMLGVFALNEVGLNGGILQMINHGISTGGLFLIVGLIYERRHTRMISDFGGLSKQLPVYATLFMIMMLSSIGLPALNGFVGEFTILLGAWQIPTGFSVAIPFTGKVLLFSAKFWSVCAVMGIVLGAGYMLWLYQRTMFGKLDKPENQALKDLSFREVMTLVPLVVLAFWIGLYPKPFFRILEPSVQRLVQQMNEAPGLSASATPPVVSPVPRAAEMPAEAPVPAKAPLASALEPVHD